MALYILNSTRVPVEFQSENSPVLSFPFFPGSKVLTYQNKELCLLIRELVTEFYTIRYNVFSFYKNQAIESISEKRGIHSRVMLQNDLHFSIEGIGNIHQKEDSVTMIWSDRARCKALFESGKDYRTLDIYIATGLINQLSFFFPELKIEDINDTPRLFLSNPCFITPAIRDVISQILECPYDAQTSQFYFDLKVREYLYVLMEQHFHSKKGGYRFTPYDKEQIIKAREILLSNLDKPPLRIRELARKVALNEFKLKAGFKHYFQTGVFECFHGARMQKAKELLLHTEKPIKDICILAGYPRMTNFITAFRRHFGYTPASLRRKE
jgi:AraC-like DNA-binding protein